MTRKAPGKWWRKGMTLMEIMDMFPDDTAAEAWFETIRWGDTGKPSSCPMCGMSDRIRVRESGKPGPYYCGHCRRHFSVRVGSVMEASKIPLRKWAVATFLWATSLKGVSSMKLHRDLGITQKSAWFMAHRLREAWSGDGNLMAGPVEIDESYFGGKRKNMSNSRRKELRGTGRGPTGKTAVAAIRDRETDTIRTKVVDSVDKPALQGFISDNVEPDATVYTDDARAYEGMDGYKRESVNHSVSQFVDDMAHVNGVESFWALFKRGYHGTFHHVSAKHLRRYASEFAGRHNIRDLDTIVQMDCLAGKMVGKRLRYRDLVA